MKFSEAFKLMKQGALIKLPSWAGYWYWSKEKQTIIIHTKDGEEFDIRKTTNPDYTFSNIASDDWIVWHLNRESLNSRAKMAMISQPVCDRTIEEIKATREKAVQALKEMGYEPIDVPFLEEWYNSKASLEQSSVVTVPEYFVAELFIRITRSNAIYFCKGWKNAVGCWLDHNAASAYGLDIIYEED